MGSPEDKFTRLLCKLRAEIEMTFGQWKSIFRYVNKENIRNYEPAKVKQFIITSIILYNFKKLNGFAILILRRPFLSYCQENLPFNTILYKNW